MAYIELVDMDAVFNVVKSHGPIMPMDIRKYIGKGDSITIGAALSGLVGKGAIKVTNVKIGSSPFYYVSGQEYKLEVLGKYLNDKDQRTFRYLKEKQVIDDSKEEPLIRVSLRNIKDFSKKLELNENDEIKLYWYWYLLTETEALNIIRNKNVIQKQEPIVEPVKEIVAEPSVLEQETTNINVEEKKLEIKIQKEEESEKEEKNKIEETEDDLDEDDEKEELETESKPMRRVVFEKLKNLEIMKKIMPEKQEVLKQDVLEDVDDKFLDKIKRFFSENHVIVKQAELIRKGSEYEFIVKFRSPFGEAEYFCKAKSKKKNNDGDLSSAFIQGQMKRLPVIYLTTGEVNKKSKEKLNVDFKGMLVKEI